MERDCVRFILRFHGYCGKCSIYSFLLESEPERKPGVQIHLDHMQRSHFPVMHHDYVTTNWADAELWEAGRQPE